MAIKDRMSGNEAVAYAIRQINPDVMPAFPITPSTEIPQMVSTYIANGEVDTEFIPVESEHSAMSAAIGAEAAGARTLTATSSAGLALMWEELLLAASNRMPLALALVNRTLSGPININCDHTDGMGARDTGWIQIYAENNQEVYDNFIQAYPIAENLAVHLPIMICQDGFITSHAVENIELLEDAPVKEFVGEYKPEDFYEMAKGMEDLKEGGERCFGCYELRLREAGLLAKEKGFDYFTTTLSISPHKNAQKLNEIGEMLSKEYGISHLPADFKKKNGYKRSIELSKEYELYRQDYCGCVFSNRENTEILCNKENV